MAEGHIECGQEDAIKELTRAVSALAKTSERHEDTAQKTLSTLEVIAEQGAHIKAIVQRQERQEADTAEIFPRLRALEANAIRCEEFMKQHEKQAEKDGALSLYVKGGLIVACILAIGAFMLYLFAHSNYGPAAPAAPPAEQHEKKRA